MQAARLQSAKKQMKTHNLCNRKHACRIGRRGCKEKEQTWSSIHLKEEGDGEPLAIESILAPLPIFSAPLIAVWQIPAIAFNELSPSNSQCYESAVHNLCWLWYQNSSGTQFPHEYIKTLAHLPATIEFLYG